MRASAHGRTMLIVSLRFAPKTPGASSVMIGRAWVYALAARGEAGVRHILAQLQREVTVTLALTGTTRVEDVDAGILRSTAS